MRGYVLREIGKIGAEDVPKPVPGEGEVLVSVRAAGICGSDIPRIYDTGAHFLPLIPGHEFSGVVTAIGYRVDASWSGKRVGVFPLLPCGECAFCRDGQYELCRHYNYLGSRIDGGFAEYVRVPVWNLLSLPDDVSFEQAAMLEPMAVAVHAMRRAELSKESSVVICGLGTIGLLLLMFLLERGIKKVFVIGNKDIQRKKALEFGAQEDFFCDSGKENADQWLKEKEAVYGIHVFFDCVGKAEVVSLACRHISPNGKVILVGNPVADMTLDKQDYWKILRNQLTLIGNWNSSFTHSDGDDWNYALKRLEEGKIHPEKMITHKLDFDSLIQGFEIMKYKKEEYVKLMGIWFGPEFEQ